MLCAGHALGDYTLLKRLAEGGMGEIYLAARLEPTGFAPPVALKVLREELASDSTFVDMLVDEAKIATRLQHHNVVSVLDFGVERGVYFIAMEYVHGLPLEHLLEFHRERQVAMDIAVGLHAAMELCSALDHAHGRRDESGAPLQIIHRDVTPGNILVSTRGDVKLTDFGLARATGRSTETMPGVLKGRFGYMAPELLRYEQIDARADVFSAGVVMYEMFTGRHPAEGASLMDALSVFEEKKYPRPSQLNPNIPQQLDDIVVGALESRQDRRWQSAGQLGHAVNALVEAWATQWPDARNGRHRLAQLSVTLFPELTQSPVAPAELEQLLSLARTRMLERSPMLASSPGFAAAGDEATLVRDDGTIDNLPIVPDMPTPIEMPALSMPRLDGPGALDNTLGPLQLDGHMTAELAAAAAAPPSSAFFTPPFGLAPVVEGAPVDPSIQILFEAPIEDMLASAAETADVPAPSDRSFSVLQRAIHVAADVGEIDDVLAELLDIVVEGLSADDGFVIISGPGDELIFVAARTVGRSTVTSPEERIARGVIQQVVVNGTVVLETAAGAESWFAGRTTTSGNRPKSILCGPIKHGGVTVGAIYLASGRSVSPFGPHDGDLVSAVGVQVALLLENERLRQPVRPPPQEQTGDLPNSYRQGLLPKAPPEVEGWEVDAFCEFSAGVDGDLYDFVDLGASGTGLVLAHVTDDETPPGQLPSTVKSTLRAALGANAVPSEALARANNLLFEQTSAKSGVTLAYAQVQPGGAELIYVNAGHPPPLFYRASEGQLFSLATTSEALGYHADLEIRQRKVNVEPGDFLVMITSGVTEAEGPGTEAFGWERLQRLIMENRRSSAADIGRSIDRALNMFAGATGLEDDFSVLVVKRA